MSTRGCEDGEGLRDPAGLLVWRVFETPLQENHRKPQETLAEIARDCSLQVLQLFSKAQATLNFEIS